MKRNPDWTRDELILALDLYFKVHLLHVSENSPEVIQLSDLLNKLPIHRIEDKSENFRNPSGVYMKLCNFLRFDPDYEGKGLDAGSKLDGEVWNDFYPNKELLIKTSNAIKNNYKNLTPIKSEEDVEEFKEGQILTRIHKQRERNPKLVKKKKDQVIKATGKLDCEVCKFNFEEHYGELGSGFAECHHNKPLSELVDEQITKLSDLSIVCANCHRMLHRNRDWLTTNQLKGLLL